MKYNAKYDRWFSKEGLVYRYDEKTDKLVLCSLCDWCKGYLRFYYRFNNKVKSAFVHRGIWETFKGEIPAGYEIDHVKCNKQDNRLKMLKLVTHKENMNNPITIEHLRDILNIRNTALRGKRNTLTTEFGKKYEAYTGLHYIDDPQRYRNEYYWFKRHGHCRWEEE